MRRPAVALGTALIVLATVVAALVLRTSSDVATPSPSTTASPSPTATASPTVSATPSASVTPLGVYVSKRVGFALTLPVPWRKATCGSSEPGLTELPLIEQFTRVSQIEEFQGHAGQSEDRVLVQVDPNPQRQSAAQLAERRYPGSPTAAVTFAGRAAVEVRPEFFGVTPLFYFMPDDDRMYSVGFIPRSSPPSEPDTMLQILRSFRFLSTAERLALPDQFPIPAPATTAEALAAMLKTAFDQRDATALERLLAPCVTQAVRPGGGSLQTRERYVSDLRQQLAAGLVVTVDTTIRTDQQGTFVLSRWNATPPGGGAPVQSPRGETSAAELRLDRTQTGFRWSGSIVVAFP